MREVYVIGIGQTMFGKMPQYTPIQLGTMAVRAALEDSGIDRRDIQVAYASRVHDATQTVEDIMKNVGVTDIEMHNCENACASGGTAFHLCWKDIALGMYDVGLVVGCESMTTCSKSGGLVGVAGGDLNGDMGITMPSNHAMIARRLMVERGLTMEDLAYPSEKAHRNAQGNPYAHYRKLLSIEDIVNGKMICDPITNLMCCPQSDGAACVIICSKEYAMKHTTRLVQVVNSTVHTAAYLPWNQDITDRPCLDKLCELTYEKAGVDPKDLDLIEIHDAFSEEEIFSYECLGLCPRGEAAKFIRDGGPEINGASPVNPSGGLLSLGHPLGASGVRVVCEVTQHLRGTAGDRQVPNAKIGMASMIGGYLTGLGAPVVGFASILKI